MSFFSGMKGLMKLLVIAIAMFFATASYAQNRIWTAYAIPNQTCGNGDPYNIFISLGVSDKISLVFQGGGACWDYATCFNPVKTPILHAPLTVKDTTGIFSLNPNKSVAYDSTMIFLPYCTGDVFAGTHNAYYRGRLVRHVGHNIVQGVLSYLELNLAPLFMFASELLVYGYSAGALGALVHMRDIESYFGYIPHKSVLLDSPGLHFGSAFWHKFSPELVKDFARAISDSGVAFDYNNGLIASTVPSACANLPTWRIGVLQSTRDAVMSTVFGNISMVNHEAAVLGPQGVYELTTSPNDNCSAWVPSSVQHTFLNTDKASPLPGGMTALNFAWEVVGTSLQYNYK